MTHALIAAKSGWGKSWFAQWWLEDNLDEYTHVVVLDRRDEFRGLVKSGYCRWMVVGPDESHISPSGWRDFIADNGRVVLARHKLGTDAWKAVAAKIATAAMALEGDVLILIDEAHKVAPQRDTVPDAIETLATEGRGNVASVWVTQRLSKLDTTPVSEMMIYLFGGFQSDSDLKKVKRNVGYPHQVHKANAGQVRRLPEDLHAPDEGAVAVRKFVDDDRTVGSEWIYSDDQGDRRRINTKDLEMESTHYGPESLALSKPGP